MDEPEKLPFEFELMLKLDHPHIAKIDEIVFNESNTHCMAVTKWIADATCRRRSGLENTTIAKAILSALDYLHERDVVHADIKLDNIVLWAGELDPETQVVPMHPYLIDFGMSFYTNNARTLLLYFIVLFRLLTIPSERHPRYALVHCPRSHRAPTLFPRYGHVGIWTVDF